METQLIFVYWCCTLLFTECIYFNRFFVELLGFSIFNIMLSANRDNFTSFSLFWMTFITFSCLTAQAMTSCTMCNKSGDNVHPCLILNFGRKASSFSPRWMMLTMGWSYMAFIPLRYFPLLPICWKFLSWLDVKFC